MELSGRMDFGNETRMEATWLATPVAANACSYLQLAETKRTDFQQLKKKNEKQEIIKNHAEFDHPVICYQVRRVALTSPSVYWSHYN